MDDGLNVLSVHQLVMGDRGRIVIPADLRSRAGMKAGTPLILFETTEGLEMYSRQQLSDKVAADLEGANLVDDLIAERRHEAGRENAEMEVLASRPESDTDAA